MGQGVLINPWKTSGEDKVEEGEGRVERDTWRRLARLSRTDIATTQDGAASAEGGAGGGKILRSVRKLGASLDIC